MSYRNVGRIAATVAVTVVASLGASASASAAKAAQPDQVCQISYPGSVHEVFRVNVSQPAPADILYYIYGGEWFRILYYSGSYYYGHGDGKTNGYLVRDWIDQSTCHYT